MQRYRAQLKINDHACDWLGVEAYLEANAEGAWVKWADAEADKAAAAEAEGTRLRAILSEINFEIAALQAENAVLRQQVKDENASWFGANAKIVERDQLIKTLKAEIERLKAELRDEPRKSADHPVESKDAPPTTVYRCRFNHSQKVTPVRLDKHYAWMTPEHGIERFIFDLLFEPDE